MSSKPNRMLYMAWGEAGTRVLILLICRFARVMAV